MGAYFDTSPVHNVDHDRFKVITVSPTITAGAYTADDAVGVLTTLTEAGRYDSGGGFITSAVLTMNDPSDNIAIDLLIWNQTVTTVADNAVMSYSDADALLLAGFISFTAGDYMAATALNVQAFKELSIPFQCGSASDDLFCQFVDRTGHTYGATTELNVTLTFTRD